MQRPIKFRAWDKQTNMMRSVLTLFGNGHVYVHCQCNPEEKYKYHRDKNIYNLSHHLSNTNIELMQFTGLTDHGKIKIMSMFTSPVRKEVMKVVNARITAAEEEYADRVEYIDNGLQTAITQLTTQAEYDRSKALEEVVSSVLKFV